MRTQTPPPELVDQCAAALMETVPAVMQFVRTEMRSQREPSLSVPQFRVLVYLDRHPGASLSEVAEHLGVTRATASTTVDRLVRQGDVERVDSPHERRLVMLTLTAAGGERLAQIRQLTRQKIVTLLSDLSSDEIATVIGGLQILHQVFGTVR